MNEIMSIFIQHSVILSFIIGLLPILVIGLITLFIINKLFKRYEQRANNKLLLERENTVLLQKSVNDLNDRLVVIEKMLKEVE
ncbi:hypothetical protein HMPREF1210_00586 [Paenisporosarcina sp. HGH0030]|uniref:hypothetical protein n=1 Tax=Paenisporosarcina sp. HGH0030 TaxID=1078085 RepID=UPI00034E7AC5|nr:hypothetical protein [Paenisporosarcina sp. HGH0030]EPD53763.1 hypothetical protein HMPREF1210_00586 [Paenisporosarcina sp. HGH0030]